MPVTRVISVIACLIGALGAAPSTAVAQDTVTFLALGSDADEVVGQGSKHVLRCRDRGFRGRPL